MDAERVLFSNGEQKLAGLYHEAAGGSRRTAVTSHGFAANKDSDKWAMVCGRLQAEGISALRFDHAGCGESEGLFEDVTLTGRIRDLRAAVRFARERGAGAVALIGSSFGGDTVLFCATDPGIAASAIVGAPFTFDFVSGAVTGASRDPDYLELDGMRVKRGVIADAAGYDIAAQAARVSRLLVMHGTLDDVVPPDDARKIYGRAAEPKQLVMVDGADHRFSGLRHREIMFDRIFEWFSKFWGAR